MTTATEVTGPVVRMCPDDPGCGGAHACPRVTPLMGLAERVNPGQASDEAVCALLRGDLAFNPASDDDDVQRMVPDGCEFLVHKSTEDDGRLLYVAVYSGLAKDRNTVLAGSPAWDTETAAARLRRMRETADLGEITAAAGARKSAWLHNPW